MYGTEICFAEIKMIYLHFMLFDFFMLNVVAYICLCVYLTVYPYVYLSFPV